MILGLDLSLTSTGVCALVDSTAAETLALKFPSTNGMERIRLQLEGLKAFVAKFGGPDSFELAVIEGYAFGATGKTFHLGRSAQERSGEEKPTLFVRGGTLAPSGGSLLDRIAASMLRTAAL